MIPTVFLCSFFVQIHIYHQQDVAIDGSRGAKAPALLADLELSPQWFSVCLQTETFLNLPNTRRSSRFLKRGASAAERKCPEFPVPRCPSQRFPHGRWGPKTAERAWEKAPQQRRLGRAGVGAGTCTLRGAPTGPGRGRGWAWAWPG